jgi:hypothetical protein
VGVEGLLAFVGVLIGAFTVLPSDRRLDLRLRMGWGDIGLLVLAILLVHLIYFQPVVFALGWSGFGPWRWGFSPESATYAIALATTLVVGLHSQLTPLPRRKMKAARALMESLLHEGRVSEVVALLERHYESIHQAAFEKSIWKRLQERVSPPPPFRINVTWQKEGGGELMPSFTAENPPALARSYRAKKWIAERIPVGEQAEEEAQILVRRLYHSQVFVKGLAKSRPYFALDLLEAESRDRYALQDLLFRELLLDPASILYYEVGNNQNISSGGRYWLDSSNRLLSFYLVDAEVAHEMGVYKPLGDWALDNLDERFSNGFDKLATEVPDSEKRTALPSLFSS